MPVPRRLDNDNLGTGRVDMQHVHHFVLFNSFLNVVVGEAAVDALLHGVTHVNLLALVIGSNSFDALKNLFINRDDRVVVLVFGNGRFRAVNQPNGLMNITWLNDSSQTTLGLGKRKIY